MDVSAIVLNKLLIERNIDIWAKLKLTFLDPAYASVYSLISRHYDKYATIPSFEELEIEVREGVGQRTLATLKLIDEPDISAEVALDALIDQYTQDLTIKLLDKFVDKLPVYDTEEIKSNLSTIVLTLDEKTLTTEGVYNMADMLLFQSKDEIAKDRVYLGLNNQFDSALGGVALQELILIGGKRGSGKSITSSNILVNQYEMGNTSVLFTIEMTAREVNERNFAILADVSCLGLKHGTLSHDDFLKVVKARAGMFEDAHDLVLEYTTHRDRFKFETALVKEKVLKQDNQMIIIDDRALNLSSIDLHIGKLKARFGEKFKVAVVDYLNKIVVDGMDTMDWKTQIFISTKLKDLARKHNIAIVSPYQIDATGEARFAKGILDPADIALVLEAHDNAISMQTTKIRGGPDQKFVSAMNWESLRLSPDTVEVVHKNDEEPKKSKKSKKDDSSADIPWDV
jgi:DnaB-like helicase C terminal domain